MAYFETEDFIVPFCAITSIQMQKAKMFITTNDNIFDIPTCNTALNKYKEWLNGQG